MPDTDFQKITLNLIPTQGDSPVVFYASQYETARPFIADLFWGETEFTPGVDCWAEIDIRKNDDNLVVITDDVTLNNNEVSVVLPIQAVTCIGKNLGQIKIFADVDHMVAAFNFIIEVQPDPLAGGVHSDTAIDNLESQIAAIVPEVIGNDYYNKTETDALLADKADVSDLPDMDDYYTKTATDALLANKADVSDLPDMTDYYNKTETDNLLSAKANTADLATVATTGDYDDLINKPTIPAAQVQSDYAQADNTQVDYIKNKPDISGMIAAAIYDILPTVSDSGPIAQINTAFVGPFENITVDALATEIIRMGSNFIDNSQLANKDFEGIERTNNVVTENYIPIKGNQGYVWHCAINNIAGRYLNFYDENQNYVSDISLYGTGDKTFTVPAGVSYYRAMWYISGGITPSDVETDFINIGSTAGTFEPYVINTYPVADIDTIQTLNGINTVYADVGDVSISAKDTIQHYIDNQ